jgi:acylphosphatase
MPLGGDSPAEEIGRRWIVSGRVQGVGFRHHVWTAAQRLSVVGDVRNLPDGRVAIRARGRAAALEELLAAVRRGPRWGQVEAIEESTLDPDAAFDEFSVR